MPLVVLSLLLQAANVAATGGGCSYDYEIDCMGGNPYSATTSVTIDAEGEASVTFHWGGQADSNVGSIIQPFASPLTLTQSHEYYKVGEFYAGVTIVFGAGSGCEGVKLQGFKLLKFYDLTCDVIDFEEETDTPTMVPTPADAEVVVSLRFGCTQIPFWHCIFPPAF